MVHEYETDWIDCGFLDEAHWPLKMKTLAIKLCTDRHIEKMCIEITITTTPVMTLDLSFHSNKIIHLPIAGDKNKQKYIFTINLNILICGQSISTAEGSLD